MGNRLAPTMNRDNQFFYDGLRQHKLLIQCCSDCKTLRVPPRPMCARCQSLNWDAVESAGRGAVYSYVMPQYPPLPFFEYPYIVVLVDLEEGVRMVSNLRDIDPADVKVGMAVEVRYQAFNDDGLVLHQFRPAAL
ncbi:Zn-ribbon domain-containing OB-fold protein [Mycobacterium sp. B14F4]|uniref:Zn-ribbon domain-containing OB-fold protein n=1 Tax=Mycobacterium sp. B14F4 TaxID=3153565 RepID=UPI00325CAA83